VAGQPAGPPPGAPPSAGRRSPYGGLFVIGILLLLILLGTVVGYLIFRLFLAI
jgi:hypothetical protein